jgi:glycosidase
MVTTDPAVPTMIGMIKIFYDTSKDPGDLHNYTGDIYVHTGVTMNGMNWQKVIGSWGNNSSQPKLVYLGNYLYELDITPDIKTFYSLSTSDIVTKICLVFRNSAGNHQTKPDIFLDIYQAGLNATFILPDKPSLVAELNSNIIIKAAATSADSISLYVNNQFIKSGLTPDIITDTITAGIYGELRIKVIAWNKPAFAEDSVFVYVRKPVVTAELPSGVKDGINYTGNTSVTLVLHAPYKSFVFVTGDFTGWLACEKGYMKKTPDGERYWLEINSLVPGKEYRFQYFVDNVLYIADPYTDKVLDPMNDLYITSATFPGLIGYPQDTASGIVSVFQTAQVPYSWQTTGYKPSEKSSLVIYELLVRDFVAKHDFKTLIDTLDYLDKLGVNAIELMPVTEFEGNLSWGYNVSFYFAPDKYYGPKNDLKAFVDSCHNRGIAVIMDMVLNHCFGQSPFVQLYLDYYGSDQIYMKLPNPWFNASSPNPVYKWGADFNHLSPSTQELVDRVCAYWLTEFKMDGFRFDFTKGFTNTPGDGSSYDTSRIAILERMANQIWTLKPEAYVILEHFGPGNEEIELANYGMMLWGNNNYNYGEAAMGYASDLTYATWLGRGWAVPNLVSYMESHDEERLMYKTITWGTSGGSYNTRDKATALRRMELDAVFLLTIPGPKMIWQFGELGYDYSIDYGGRVSEKPIRWDYFSDPDRHRLYTIYQLLNNHKTRQVFETDNYSYSLSTPLKRLTLDQATMKVNVLGNFGVTPSYVTPGFPQTGKWYEYFTGDSITVVDINDPLDFQPGEYRLYTTKKLAPSGLVSGIEDHNIQARVDFVTVYPNPSAVEFNFLIESEIPIPVSVMIFDITGRMIRKLITEIPGDGTQTITWDGRAENGSEATGGIYIIQVRTPQRIQTLKVMKISN